MLFLTAFLALLALATAAPQVANTRPTASGTAAAATTTRTPVPTESCMSDNYVKPWVINDISLVTPAPGDTAPTQISFHFHDPSKDLVLTTNCAGLVDENGDADLDNGGYLACDDPAVRFQLKDGQTVLVSRFYADPCKGSPPWDKGIAYGQADAKCRTVAPTNGNGPTMKFQSRMEMNVTKLS